MFAVLRAILFHKHRVESMSVEHLDTGFQLEGSKKDSNEAIVTHCYQIKFAKCLLVSFNPFSFKTTSNHFMNQKSCFLLEAQEQ